jgi:hypothetical protein
MKSLDDQFAEVSLAFAGAVLTPADNGMYLVRIPNVSLPEGWSQQSTEVRFVVPNGYPYAAPDCFWADMSLRLKNGTIPQNSVPGQSQPGQPDTQILWFSWHLNNNWNPSTCDLMTYVRVIRKRFEAVQ